MASPTFFCWFVKKKATPLPCFQRILLTLTSSPHAVRALPSGRAATAPPEKKGSTADSRRHDARLVGAVDAIGLFFSFNSRLRVRLFFLSVSIKLAWQRL